MQRILIELKTVKKDYDVEFVNDDVYHWHVAVHGPVGTPYYGGTFLLDIVFPKNYPFDKPAISFKTVIYHPNINRHGEVCLSLLSSWNPAYTIQGVLNVLVSLLSAPNLDDPLEPTIATQYVSNHTSFLETASRLTHNHAM